MTTNEDRLGFLEHQLVELGDTLNQLANDLELASVNIKRALKTQYPQQHQNNTAKTSTWNPNNVKWTQDVGKKGPYEKADDGAADYQAMLKDLKDHNGKLNHEGRFYWLFSDEKTVGRTLPK